MAGSHSRHAGAGCGQEAPFPGGPIWRASRVSSHTAAGSPQSEQPEGARRSCNVSHDLVPGVTRHHFCRALLATRPRCSVGGHYVGREDHWWPGATLEAADLTVQLLAQPPVSKDSFVHPSMKQTLPHSFLSSAGSSPGASPRPNTG